MSGVDGSRNSNSPYELQCTHVGWWVSSIYSAGFCTTTDRSEGAVYKLLGRKDGVVPSVLFTTIGLYQVLSVQRISCVQSIRLRVTFQQFIPDMYCCISEFANANAVRTSIQNALRLSPPEAYISS